MKPFVVEDVTKFPPFQWSFYLFGVLIGFLGCLLMYCRWSVGIGEVGSNKGDVSLLYTFGGIIGLWTGAMFIGVGRLAQVSSRAQSELSTRLAEQDERIKKLEAQVAALIPSSPKP